MLARQQLAAANAHQRDRRVVAVARVADDVAIAALDRHARPPALPSARDGRSASRSSAARSKSSDSDAELHALAHAPHHFVRAPVEKDEHLVDHRADTRPASARECTAPCIA